MPCNPKNLALFNFSLCARFSLKCDAEIRGGRREFSGLSLRTLCPLRDTFLSESRERSILSKQNPLIVFQLTFLPFHSYLPAWPSSPEIMVYNICTGWKKKNHFAADLLSKKRAADQNNGHSATVFAPQRINSQYQ